MKYKLKKWYPSLPKDWEVGMEVGQDDRFKSYYSPCNGKYKEFFVNFEQVEQNEEFWEKVVPKEFEILKRQTYPCQGASNGGNYQVIESVKRLSDGEVFTIGDKDRISKLQHDGSFTIDEFYFDCNNDKLLCNGKCTGNGHVSITKIEHCKKPLFTTEDGVEMFEGDTFYWYAQSINEIMKSTVKKGATETDSNRFKKFSNIESAQSYYNFEQKLFSAND